jgi:5-bromo-4-chloroindolyl phosphate hydrolysis protein
MNDLRLRTINMRYLATVELVDVYLCLARETVSTSLLDDARRQINEFESSVGSDLKDSYVDKIQKLRVSVDQTRKRIESKLGQVAA